MIKNKTTQIREQAVIEEAAIGAQAAELAVRGQERERLAQELVRAAAGARVTAAQPGVQDKVRLGEHRHQGMMDDAPGPARVVVRACSLLLAVAGEQGRVEVQGVSVRTRR